VVGRCAGRIDACAVTSFNPECADGTRDVVVIHNGLKCKRSELRVLDRVNIALVAHACHEREVARSETVRVGAISLAVPDAHPPVIERAVQERGAVDDVGRNCEEDRTGVGGDLTHAPIVTDD